MCGIFDVFCVKLLRVRGGGAIGVYGSEIGAYGLG
jgi:hypothetical protein